MVAEQRIVDDRHVGVCKALGDDVVDALARIAASRRSGQVAQIAMVRHLVASLDEGVILCGAVARVPVGTHDHVLIVLESLDEFLDLDSAIGSPILSLVPIQVCGNHLHDVAIQTHGSHQVVALLHHLRKHHCVCAQHLDAIAEDGVAVVGILRPYLRIVIVAQYGFMRIYCRLSVCGIHHQRVILYQGQDVGIERIEVGAVGMLVEVEHIVRELCIARLAQGEVPYVPTGHGDFRKALLLSVEAQAHQCAESHEGK